MRRIKASLIANLHRVQLGGMLLVLFVLRPFRTYRLGTFRADRIGHLIAETDLVIQLLKCDENRRTHEIFLFPDTVCNEVLKILYIKSLRELPNVSVFDAATSRIARQWLAPVQRLADIVMSSGHSHWAYCGARVSGGIEVYGLRPSGRPHLSLTEEDKNAASHVADQLGINLDRPYACLQVRDSQYLSNWDPTRDWSYHSYRNPDPQTYLELVRKLTSRGIQVVRMGKDVSGPFPFAGPGFIDYASSNLRSDLLDVALYQGCMFAVSGAASGIEQLGTTFNRPLVTTNLIPFSDPRTAVDLNVVLPCLLRDEEGGDFLPLSQMMRSRFGGSHEYESARLEIVRNSAEEIVESVMETVSRLEGTWTSDEEDEALQVEFWNWADTCGIANSVPADVSASDRHRAVLGSAFLRSHRDVLLA